MIPFNVNVPLLMVVAFLLLTLVVGFYFSRKTNTLREYAVGSKQFATATLVATVLATAWGGGGVVRTVEQIHRLGLYQIVVLFSSSISLWIISLLALRMGPFMQNLSMSETIGNAFGSYPRIISSLAFICASIPSIATQITVTSIAIGIGIGPDALASTKYITICATFILIFYSTLGGIRAVTFTDVLQFVTFSIIIPLLAWFMFKQITTQVTVVMPFLQSQEKFQWSSVFRWNAKLIAMIALLLSNLMSSSIAPSKLQRIYMSSTPIQAKKVFLYSSLFNLMITGCVILTGLFVFVGAPELSVKEIWHGYIIPHISPVFQGCIAISLLAMTMSTADSKLNTCAIMMSHDIMGSLRGVKLSYTHSFWLVRLMAKVMGLWVKVVPSMHPLLLARLTALMVGLAAMKLAFDKQNDLLKLMMLVINVYVPIVTAPFILAILGFRSSSHTALIGMTTGALTMLAWNTWIKLATIAQTIIGIDGSFPCMLANGLAMLAAHYLLPQPPGTGWVGPDDELKQIRQANERKKERRKEETRAFFSKENLAKLKPDTATLIGVGIYTMVTSFLVLFTGSTMEIYWPLFQLTIGGSWVTYAIFFQKPVPDWKVGRFWLLSLMVCFPLNILCYWWHRANLLLILPLSLTHLAVILWLLPLYWGIRIVVATLVGTMLICCLGTAVVWPSTTTLLPLLGLALLIFASIIYAKRKITVYTDQNYYLKNQQKLKEAQKLKSLAYNLHLHIDAATVTSQREEDGTILERVVKDVTQSISFLDDHPLYKQDFQSIINKFSEWAIFLKKQVKSKDHILLIPTEISINALMNKIEVALAQEMENSPRLFIEHKDNTVPVKIVCDAGQIIHLLVTAVLRIANLNRLETIQFIRIQLHTTHLKYEKSDPIHSEYHPAIVFPAIAMVVSNATTPPAALPKIQSYYEDITYRKNLSGTVAT